jgi:hypothetical protein
VIFFSFISPRSPCRYDAAGLASERADDDDFERFDEATDEEARFPLSVRAADEDRLIDYLPGIQKIDLVFAQIAPAFALVPFERLDGRWPFHSPPMYIQMYAFKRKMLLPKPEPALWIAGTKRALPAQRRRGAILQG